jgi:PTS system N-acetylgalactosamine-specific IIA component
MTSSPTDPSQPAGAAAGANAGSHAVAVVAAHGDLAAGLVSAVAQITGRGDLLLAVSNRGLGPAEIQAALRAAVDGSAVRAVFTDLPGGSCTMAARRLQRERPELSVATGVNLAALLDFVFAADAPAVGDAAEHDVRAEVARAVERGRAALAACAPPPPAAAAPPTPTAPAHGG